MLFATHLADTHKKPSTIRSYVSAIKHKLRSDGVELDDQTLELTAIVRAVKLNNDRIYIRLPLGKRLFPMILDAFETLYHDQQ